MEVENSSSSLDLNHYWNMKDTEIHELAIAILDYVDSSCNLDGIYWELEPTIEEMIKNYVKK